MPTLDPEPLRTVPSESILPIDEPEPLRTVRLDPAKAGQGRASAAVRALEEIAKSGAAADAPTKLRFKRDLAYAAQISTEAVDILHAMAGANGIYDSYPIQRIFRDAHALGGHADLHPVPSRARRRDGTGARPRDLG